MFVGLFTSPVDYMPHFYLSFSIVFLVILVWFYYLIVLSGIYYIYIYLYLFILYFGGCVLVWSYFNII